MSKCILCGEDDPELIQPHHTIPRSLLPLWTKTTPLCYKCHKKVHKYIILDLRELISDLKTSFIGMELIFNLWGLFAGERVGDAFSVLRAVVSHINDEALSVKQLSNECDIKNQRVGCILKNMGIKRTRNRKGMIIRFTPFTVEKITQLAIKNGLLPKELSSKQKLKRCQTNAQKTLFSNLNPSSS